MFPKQPSSWLDRLRSNKGIPTTQDLNLDQFLTQIPNSDQIPPKPNPSPPPPNPKWLNSISSALAELFVMEDEDDGHTKFRRKASRKQPNPKIFIDRREVVEEKSPERAAEVREVEEKLDLAGYSRSDLVIIDTSSSGSGNCVSWKTEKIVFRKGSVWKVREKKWKGRSLVVGRKKRKFSKVDHYDDGSEDEKKKKKKKRMKMKKIKQKVARIGKKGHDGGHPFQVCVENAQQVANKEIQRNLQVSMKRCKFFMPAKRSSVFGTQNTPSSKENVVPLGLLLGGRNTQKSVSKG